MRRRINVTFSPPTPNGDLHLGHLSGPVLAADICSRSQRTLGNDVAFASSTDDNQTYVVTTARRLGTSPEALIQEADTRMRASFELGGIGLDLFARPDRAYEEFVRGFFTRLWQGGAFDRREVELPFDEGCGEYRAEAFVTGRCPICLAQARAGVCEACGLYNLPAALLAMGDSESELPRRRVSIWVLDLERYRSLITDCYDRSAVGRRPDLQSVVSQSLAGRLPYIPITYPSAWGIPVDWDGPDAGPQAINAWPEIFVGHLHWLAQARQQPQPNCDELVQFIGIDNGFYNAFVYLTLGRLAVQHGVLEGVPTTRTVTNQYFLLEGRKFSTSKGDVVWAGEFLERLGRDRARFVLSLTSPELQQSQFSEQVAAQTLEARFDRPLAAAAANLNRRLTGRSVEARPSDWWGRALDASQRRFAAAYALPTFSIRAAAEALALHLEVLALRSENVETGDAGEVAGVLQFLWALRSLAWPVTPDLAEAVAVAFGGVLSPAPPLFGDAGTAPAGRFRGFSPASIGAEAGRVPASA